MTDSSPLATVTLEGIDVSAVVRRVEVEDSDRLIDKATIWLDDDDGAAADVFFEGQSVLIDMGWTGEHAVLFEGIVVRATTEAVLGRTARVKLVAYDLAYKLMQGPPATRDHVGSLRTILTELCTKKPYGFTVGDISPGADPTFTAEQPLRQVGLRDWEFIQALAVRHGCRAFVEYNDKRSQFYFVAEDRLLGRPSLGTIDRDTGRLLRFEYSRVASIAAPERTAVVADVKGAKVKKETPKSAPKPPAPPNPERLTRIGRRFPGAVAIYTRARAQTAAALARPAEQRPQQHVLGLPSDPSLAEQSVRSDPTRALGWRAEGEAMGTVFLRAKGKITIKGLGIAEWAEGDWYVHTATHVYTRAVGLQAGGYRTRFVVTR